MVELSPKLVVKLNFISEMFSNEILEISLSNPEEKNDSDGKMNEGLCKIVSSATGNDNEESEPTIGIIKLGETPKAKQNLIKNLMCEHCGKKFNKSNQLFVHTRTHTSKLRTRNFYLSFEELCAPKKSLFF